MRRVVITGIGVVAPNGVGKDPFWSACLNGRSGVGPIRSFDASAHPVKIAAEVHDFDVGPYLQNGHRKSLKIMSRAMRFAVGAAGLSIKDSGNSTLTKKTQRGSELVAGHRSDSGRSAGTHADAGQFLR